MSEMAMLRQPSSGTRFSGILLGVAMNDNRKRDQWLEDVEARQHNVAFPDTVQNETRFWRNLGKQPWTTSTKVGLAALGLLGWGFFAVVLGVTWAFVLGMILFCGPLFGAIAWATRRSLRNIENARHHPDSRKR
jgi:hypothetical protein